MSEMRGRDREALAEAHAGLVRRIAYKLAHARLPTGLDVEDLVGYGAIGLMQAVDRFDPKKGVPFAAFATLKIKGAILDGLRSYHPLPSGWQRKRRQVDAAAAALEMHLEREPSTAEVAEAVHMGAEEVQQLPYNLLASTLSLEELFPHDFLVQDTAAPSPEDEAVAAGVRARLEVALERLTEKERLIILLVYREDLTLTECGRVLDLTTARCSQLHRRAIVRLRGLLGSEKRELMEGGD